MADYIDRVQALGYPLSFDHYDKENGNKHFINGVESYGEYIEGLPSIDAVEVVRCKDCMHHKRGICEVANYFVMTDNNFYCARGEKE